jgi:hypothetical protein
VEPTAWVTLAGSKAKLAALGGWGSGCGGLRRTIPSRRGRRCLTGAPEFDRRCRPHLQRLLIQVSEFPGPHNVRDHGKDDLVFLVLDVALGEQIFQDGNLRQSRNPTQRTDVLILQDSTQQVHFAFLQPNLMLNLPLPDHGLADASDVRLPGNR